MNKHELKKIRNTFVLQQDETDCGVACLRSVCRYHGADHSSETLRQLTGCGLEGTSMFSLREAALQLNLRAEGFEMTMTDLDKLVHPIILHVTIHTRQHYIVYYGHFTKVNEKLLVIGDPAQGILFLRERELEQIWLSHAALFLEPRGSFYQWINKTKKEKREWMIAILKSHFPILAITGILGIIIAALGLTVSVFSQQLIDKLLPARKFAEVYIGIAAVILLLGIKEVLALIRNRLMLTEGRTIHFSIAGNFLAKMLHLPHSFFNGRSIGDLTSRIHDTARIQRVIIQLFGNSCIDVLVVIVSFIMISFYSPAIAFGCMLVSPVYFWIVLHGQKPMRLAQQKMFEANAGNESVLMDILKGVHVVRQTNRQSWFADAYNQKLDAYLKSIVTLGFKQSNLLFQANIAGSILIGAIIGAGAYQILNDSLKTGEFIAILSITANLLPGIGNLAASIFPISEGTIALNRLFECRTLLKNETSESHNLVGKRDLNEGIEKVEFNRVSFRFPGKQPLLKDISCRFGKASIIGLTGKNGCGKTSLAQLLMKDYQSDDGSISVNDVADLALIGAEQWRNAVSIVPQQVHIFNGSVLENIAFEHARSARPLVVDFLKKIGLIDFISMLPNAGDTIVGEKGVSLSGGQQQVIGWARALYRKPRVLILDEAFAHLDEKMTFFFLELLQLMKHSMIILVITHQQEVLRACDQVFELKHGKLNLNTRCQLMR